MNRSTRWLGLLLLFAGLCLMATEVRAQAPNKSVLQNQSDDAAASPDPTQPTLSVLDVNNKATWITRSAFYNWVDPFSADNDAYPARTEPQITFSQGPMWGGKVKDGEDPVVRVNGTTYQNGMAPGGIDWDPQTGEVFGPENADNRSKFHVWRVHRNWASDDVVRESAAYTNGIDDPANVGQQAITDTRDQYEYDWNNWPADRGAPFEECGGGPSYQPADPERVNSGVPCEDLDGDIPGFPGADQTIWVVTNDIGSQSDTDASQGSYGSPAVGMEIQTTMWGYDRPPSSPLGNVNFIETELIYTGLPGGPDDARIDSMFTTWWVDPDVGTFSNDFAGVDTSTSMGMAYNAEATDDEFEQEGLAPAAGGWDFFKGPVNAEGDTLGLSSYVFFAAGSDISDPDLGVYNGTLQWYNLMRGKRPRPEYPQGDPFINPNTGGEAVFTLPGDPVSGEGWIDGSTLPPGDRRIVNTSGPFTLAKGDTASIVVGTIGAVGSSNLSSISRLRFFDQAAQFAFDQNFDIPSPPATPSVEPASLDERVVLNWGTNDDLVNQIETNQADPGFEFQAYRVYQLPSRSASLEEGVRIATFDKEDNVRTLVDNVFEEESGFVVEKPIQSLKNEGVSRHISITQDRIRDRPIANGVDYHFAVTALSYLPEDTDVPSRILESSPRRVTVRPKAPEPGVVNQPEFNQELPVSKESGSGDAIIQTKIIDPSQVVDADWAITFNDGSWNLEKNGSPVLSNQKFGFLPERQTVDGVKVDVRAVTFSAPETILVDEQIEGDGLDLWGDATLFGAPVGYYQVFTGQDFPPVEDAQQDLEFRFTGNGAMEEPTTEGGQLATYYANGAFGSTQPDTVENNTIRMPFELWETEQDRQINFAIIGRNADENSPWGAGAPPDDGYYRMAARDYIVPIHTEYDEQQVQNNGTSPAAEEASWLLFFEQGGVSVWETGDVHRVTFANPIVPGTDRWSFSTGGPETDEEDLQASVEDIGVFPNPYRGFNRLEDSRFDKFVRFVNLPNPAEFGPSTIRIFTLSGAPVRILRHTEENSPNPNFHDWDLENSSGVPVASGLYLVHLDTPAGEKTLKVALVMEEEILRRQ